jgi:phage gp46-like protein
MTDVALRYDQNRFVFDLEIENGDLKIDYGLETAVWISLFSDRRATRDDPIPDTMIVRLRGWWADVAGEITTDLIGSKLWLLIREKVVEKIVEKARHYAEEALQWLIDDDIAETVLVEAFLSGRDILGLNVVVTKTDGAKEAMSYEYKWTEAA